MHVDDRLVSLPERRGSVKVHTGLAEAPGPERDPSDARSPVVVSDTEAERPAGTCRCTWAEPAQCGQEGCGTGSSAYYTLTGHGLLGRPSAC